MTMLSTLTLALWSALPVQASQRYQVEIGGRPVGWAELSIDCRGLGCEASWQSALALPAEAGGRLAERTVRVRADKGFSHDEVEIDRRDARGERHDAREGRGLPAMLAEVALSAAKEGQRLCVPVFAEEGGGEGEGCATRVGPWLEGEVLGVALRFRSAPDGMPLEVQIPSQKTRYLADAAADLPRSPPELFGSEVPFPPGAEHEATLRFCGAALDPPPAVRPPPVSFPATGNCRAQTAKLVAWLAGQGVAARHVVGVAWDGGAFVWHEWAEAKVGRAWVAIDPAFRQSPAKGPRFSLARFDGGDEVGLAAAGQRVLGCWGSAKVELR